LGLEATAQFHQRQVRQRASHVHQQDRPRWQVWPG
jgi:hypothetical protein